jgi:hypothetical protein
LAPPGNVAEANAENAAHFDCVAQLNFEIGLPFDFVNERREIRVCTKR